MTKNSGRALPPPHLWYLPLYRPQHQIFSFFHIFGYPHYKPHTPCFFIQISHFICANKNTCAWCVVHSACGYCRLKQSGLKVVWQGVSIFCILPIRPYAAIWIYVKINVWTFFSKQKPKSVMPLAIFEPFPCLNVLTMHFSEWTIKLDTSASVNTC